MAMVSPVVADFCGCGWSRKAGRAEIEEIDEIDEKE